MWAVAVVAGIVVLAVAASQAKSVPSDKDFEAALKKLEAKPEDPDANQTVARYMSFVQEKFKEALPYAEKSKDKLLASVLAAEAKDDQNKFTSVEIGDAWLKAGDKAGALKPLYRDRSVWWYGRGWEQGLSADPVWGDQLRAKLELLQAIPVKPAYVPGQPKGWKLWGGTFLGQKYAKTGRRSAALSGGLNKNKGGEGTQFEGTWYPVPANAKGKMFVFSAFVLADRTDTAGDTIFLNVQDQAGTPLVEKGISFAPDQPYWRRYVYMDTMPANAARFRVLINGPSEQGMVYVDDIILVVDGQNILPNGSFEN